jgi:hypothetical protein
MNGIREKQKSECVQIATVPIGIKKRKRKKIDLRTTAAPLCKCSLDCDRRVTWSEAKKCWNRFFIGHSEKGKHRSEGFKENLRNPSEKRRKEMSIRQKLKWEDLEYKKSQSEAISKGLNTEEAKLNSSVAMKKRFEDPNERMKISISKTGTTYHEKEDGNFSRASKKKWEDVVFKEKTSKAIRVGLNKPGVRLRMSLSHKKRYEDPEERRKTSDAMKKVWGDPVFFKMMGEKFQLKPNKTELFVFDLLNTLCPNEWEYVGDFSLLIGGKNPDFVHKTKKLLIEFFGNYWHREHDAKDRIKVFKPFGYKTLVIWESELKNTNKVMSRIERFNKNHG